jgi:uncharacterized RDD family membrane protein YckC
MESNILTVTATAPLSERLAEWASRHLAALVVGALASLQVMDLPASAAVRILMS